MSEWDPDELQALRAFFLDEANEHVVTVADELGRLKSRPDDRATAASLLRTLHTMKGSAGSVELSDIAMAAHRFEGHLIALQSQPHPEPELFVALEASLVELRALLHDAALVVRPPSGMSQLPTPPPPTPPPRADRRAVERALPGVELTVRVEVERIDELMDAASELVLDRARISRRLLDVEVRARELGDAALQRLCVALGDEVEGLSRSSSILQERIRRVRHMQVGRLFARLTQPVRELARKEGKEVELITQGEAVEIDKATVERVAEPLLHLLRNAVAHGIEPPAVRRALGKAPAGRVTLAARAADDAVEISVSDDGQGIDLAGVRRALVAAGRVDEAAAARLPEAALYAALFEPGVSTRVAADDLAGRGVGLDAVREAVTRLHGTVRLGSTTGRGTRFVVSLPVTTVVQEALLFKVGGQLYAVPSARVQQYTEVTPLDLRLGAEERVVVGGRELPLVRLGALLGIPPPPGDAKRIALVLSAGDFTFACTCDKVIGPRDIVVRNLGPLLAKLPLYAGATISGAGKVQLILDVARLADLARRGVRYERPTRELGPPRVLVVDDSRSIREAASLILAQGGYATDGAADGFDAWELLQDGPYVALVTDLEMPRLDGYALLDRVRRSPVLVALPVVVVSSRADETRDRVLAAGADGVVEKPLKRKALLDAIDEAISARATAPGRPE
jgi:two-component system chemotaxis sensor kinase CheA